MRRPPLPPAIITAALAGIVSAWLWRWSGKDIGYYLVPWYQHIRAAGPVGVFAAPFANYAPPYLYLLAAASLLEDWADAVTLIKALSVAGTLVLAGAAWRLLVALTPGDIATLRKAAMVLLLPTVLVNAVVLGQSDAMWAAACLMALAAAARWRHVRMLAWCGLALGIKLQAIFLAPFVLALLMKRRVPLRSWPVAALAWLATLAPAWLAGWPAADLLTIYLRQGSSGFTDVALNAPNWWTLAAPWLSASPSATVAALAFALVVVGGYVTMVARGPLTPERLVAAACLSPLLVAGVLPRMHERYFFLADILSLILALAWPARRNLVIAILVQAGSATALFAYLSGIESVARIGAAAMIAVTVMLTRQLIAGSDVAWRRRLSAAPIPRNPSSMVPQVAGSGTAPVTLGGEASLTVTLAAS